MPNNRRASSKTAQEDMGTAEEEHRRRMKEVQKLSDTGNQEFVFTEFLLLLQTYKQTWRLLELVAYIIVGLVLWWTCVIVNDYQDLNVLGIKHDMDLWINHKCNFEKRTETVPNVAAALGGGGVSSLGPYESIATSDIGCVVELTRDLGNKILEQDFSFLNDTHMAPKVIPDSTFSTRVLTMRLSIPPEVAISSACANLADRRSGEGCRYGEVVMETKALLKNLKISSNFTSTGGSFPMENVKLVLFGAPESDLDKVAEYFSMDPLIQADERKGTFFYTTVKNSSDLVMGNAGKLAKSAKYFELGTDTRLSLEFIIVSYSGIVYRYEVHGLTSWNGMGARSVYSRISRVYDKLFQPTTQKPPIKWFYRSIEEPNMVGILQIIFFIIFLVVSLKINLVNFYHRIKRVEKWRTAYRYGWNPIGYHEWLPRKVLLQYEDGPKTDPHSEVDYNTPMINKRPDTGETIEDQNYGTYLSHDGLIEFGGPDDIAYQQKMAMQQQEGIMHTQGMLIDKAGQQTDHSSIYIHAADQTQSHDFNAEGAHQTAGYSPDHSIYTPIQPTNHTSIAPNPTYDLSQPANHIMEKLMVHYHDGQSQSAGQHAQCQYLQVPPSRQPGQTGSRQYSNASESRYYPDDSSVGARSQRSRHKDRDPVNFEGSHRAENDSDCSSGSDRRIEKYFEGSHSVQPASGLRQPTPPSLSQPNISQANRLSSISIRASALSQRVNEEKARTAASREASVASSVGRTDSIGRDSSGDKMMELPNAVRTPVGFNSLQGRVSFEGSHNTSSPSKNVKIVLREGQHNISFKKKKTEDSADAGGGGDTEKVPAQGEDKYKITETSPFGAAVVKVQPDLEKDTSVKDISPSKQSGVISNTATDKKSATSKKTGTPASKMDNACMQGYMPGMGDEEDDYNKPSWQKRILSLLLSAAMRPVDLIVMWIRIGKYALGSLFWAPYSFWPLAITLNSLFGILVTLLLFIEFLEPKTELLDTFPAVATHVKKRCANIDAEFQECKFDFSDEHLLMYTKFLDELQSKDYRLKTILVMLGAAILCYSLHAFQFTRFNSAIHCIYSAVWKTLVRFFNSLFSLLLSIFGVLIFFVVLSGTMFQPGVFGIHDTRYPFFVNLISFWDYDYVHRVFGDSERIGQNFHWHATEGKGIRSTNNDISRLDKSTYEATKDLMGADFNDLDLLRELVSGSDMLIRGRDPYSDLNEDRRVDIDNSLESVIELSFDDHSARKLDPLSKKSMKEEGYSMEDSTGRRWEVNNGFKWRVEYWDETVTNPWLNPFKTSALHEKLRLFDQNRRRGLHGTSRRLIGVPREGDSIYAIDEKRNFDESDLETAQMVERIGDAKWDQRMVFEALIEKREQEIHEDELVKGKLRKTIGAELAKKNGHTREEKSPKSSAKKNEQDTTALRETAQSLPLLDDEFINTIIHPRNQRKDTMATKIILSKDIPETDTRRKLQPTGPTDTSNPVDHPPPTFLTPQAYMLDDSSRLFGFYIFAFIGLFLVANFVIAIFVRSYDEAVTEQEYNRSGRQRFYYKAGELAYDKPIIWLFVHCLFLRFIFVMFKIRTIKKYWYMLLSEAYDREQILREDRYYKKNPKRSNSKTGLVDDIETGKKNKSPNIDTATGRRRSSFDEEDIKILDTAQKAALLNSRGLHLKIWDKMKSTLFSLWYFFENYVCCCCCGFMGGSGAGGSTGQSKTIFSRCWAKIKLKFGGTRGANLLKKVYDAADPILASNADENFKIAGVSDDAPGKKGEFSSVEEKKVYFVELHLELAHDRMREQQKMNVAAEASSPRGGSSPLKARGHAPSMVGADLQLRFQKGALASGAKTQAVLGESSLRRFGSPSSRGKTPGTAGTSSTVQSMQEKLFSEDNLVVSLLRNPSHTMPYNITTAVMARSKVQVLSGNPLNKSRYGGSVVGAINIESVGRTVGSGRGSSGDEHAVAAADGDERPEVEDDGDDAVAGQDLVNELRFRDKMRNLISEDTTNLMSGTLPYHNYLAEYQPLKYTAGMSAMGKACVQGISPNAGSGTSKTHREFLARALGSSISDTLIENFIDPYTEEPQIMFLYEGWTSAAEISEKKVNDTEISPKASKRNVKPHAVIRKGMMNALLDRDFVFKHVLLPKCWIKEDKVGAKMKGRKGVETAYQPKDQSYWDLFIMTYIASFLYGTTYLPRGIPKHVPGTFLDELSFGAPPTNGLTSLESRLGKSIYLLQGQMRQTQENQAIMVRKLDAVERAQGILVQHALDQNPTKSVGKMFRREQEFQQRQKEAEKNQVFSLNASRRIV